jgi:YD repeat-containing protein
MANPTCWKKVLYRFLFLGFLVGVGIYIWSLYLPFHAPELLPLPPAHPATDGSYPELLIRYDPAVSGSAPFHVSFTRGAPSLVHDSPVNQFEVKLSNGEFVLRQTDLFSPGAIPISLTRTYSSFDRGAQAFGVGGSQAYDVCPFGSRFPYTYIDMVFEDGDSLHFERISKGTGYTDAIYEHRDTSSPEFFGARIRWNGDGWDLTLPKGNMFFFPEAYNAKTVSQGAMTEIHNGSGQRVKIMRRSSGDMEDVVSSGGGRVDFSYDKSGRIIETHDDAGNNRRYSYDSDGRLVLASDTGSILYMFAYDRWDRMTRVLDGKGADILVLTYRSGRVDSVRLGSGEIYRFTYDIDAGKNVTRTVVVCPDGSAREFSFR